MNRICLSITLAVLLLAAPAAADWDPIDGSKMHYPQLPDPIGWDVNATWPTVVADDWGCSESGFVDDIHFWGSWQHDIVGTIQSFHLSIHSNVPIGPGGYSQPGELLWEWETTDFIIRPVDPPSDQGWYDPSSGQWNRPDHQAYFQYNIVDIPNAFYQDVGTIYWLDISARVVEPDLFWGWKTSRDHWMDDAVWSDLAGVAWQELFDPITGESLDMAFVITPEPASMLLLISAAVLLRRR